jgi:hypothetical protein
MSSKSSWTICKGLTAAMSTVLLWEKEARMNLSLLQRPKKIKKGTKTMYVYHPHAVTASDKLEPGEPLHILDVFEGATRSETTLKVMKGNEWEAHKWGRGVPQCRVLDLVGDRETKELCDCEKELSEMEPAFKELVHYVLLTDVGK